MTSQSKQINIVTLYIGEIKMKFIEHEMKTIDGVQVVEYHKGFKLWFFMIFVAPPVQIIILVLMCAHWWGQLIMTGVKGIMEDYDYDDFWETISTPFRFLIAKKVKVDKGGEND